MARFLLDSELESIFIVLKWHCVEIMDSFPWRNTKGEGVRVEFSLYFMIKELHFILYYSIKLHLSFIIDFSHWQSSVVAFHDFCKAWFCLVRVTVVSGNSPSATWSTSSNDNAKAGSVSYSSKKKMWRAFCTYWMFL